VQALLPSGLRLFQAASSRQATDYNLCCSQAFHPISLGVPQCCFCWSSLGVTQDTASGAVQIEVWLQASGGDFRPSEFWQQVLPQRYAC